ncbi:MAG: hypothetical protein KIT72_16345 [Polyangiaceae bacterium]|nr:hypothetical protein [Polyangiaceae bacterium]MCW5791989.1 hypothetical protein [Polyangiaceae bacterium]
MMYLWLALPLALSIAISLLSQMERKRLKQVPLPEDLGEWRVEAGGWEQREIVVTGSLLFGDSLVLQRRRRDETGAICEVAPERRLRRVWR